MTESQPDTSTGSNDLTYAEGDPTVFVNRYPTLAELLSKAGKEGIEYCLVDRRNQRRFEHDSDEDGETWWQVDRLPTLSIVGPNGVAESVVLMGRGKPTYGAADFNGRRKYAVDLDIEEATGLPADPNNPLTKLSNIPIARVKEENAKSKEAKAGASKEG
jgi:hypothetical protein